MPDEIMTLLDSYHMSALQEMAIAAHIEVMQGRRKLKKTELLAKMQTEFFTQDRVQASLQKLSKREQAVLNRLLLRGGKTVTRGLKREVIRAELATEPKQPKKNPGHYNYSRSAYAPGYTGDPHRQGSTIFEDIIARLTYHGLVFSQEADLEEGGTPYKLRFHPAPILYIPTVIRPYLPDPEPVEVSQSNWQPARVETGEPTLLLRDLYLYWDFVRRHEVPLIQSGLIGKRALKAINDILLVPDPRLKNAKREDETDRLYLLRQLLQALTLVKKTPGRLRPVIDHDLHIPEFWDLALMAQLQACLKAWSALTGLPTLVSDRYGTQPLQAREAVLDVLKTLPPAIWFEADELLERVQEEDIDFLIPDHSRVENHRGSWYHSYSGGYFSGQRENLLKTFERLEAEFVNNCLTGFLYELGLVELGYDSAPVSAKGIRSANGTPSPAASPLTGNTSHTGDSGMAENNKPHAFRLTAAGQALLGLNSGTPLFPQDDGKLIIQPNFHLMAIGPVSLKILAHLDLFAERRQADRSVFEYQVSRESIYRAQQLGFDVKTVINFLTDMSEVTLPQNIQRSLEEWATHHERIVFRTSVSLLQAADASLLTQLQHQAPIDKLLARSLTPELALISPENQGKLVSSLIKQDLFPAVSGMKPESADHSVIIQADGTIQPVHTVPSLHLHGRLARLAEEIDDQGWRITPKSVHRAGGSRNKVLRLLDELRKLHRGPLPDELVTQIQSWGGYYGQAAIETLTLIEFQDQPILQDLSKHPDLQPHLTPFSAGNRALAVVSTEKLVEVKEILARFGIRIKDGL